MLNFISAKNLILATSGLCFPKKKKLTSRKEIDELFLSKGNLRLTYKPLILIVKETSNELNSTEPSGKAVFVVSKKKIKTATSRNQIRRRIRESYRLNQNLFNFEENRSYSLALIYNSIETLPYVEINESVISLAKKFNEVLKQDT